MKRAKRYSNLIVSKGACNPANYVDKEYLKEIQRSFHYAPSDIGSSSSIAVLMRKNGPAVAVCMRCPVRKQCLEYSLIVNEQSSIWGGYPNRLRKQILRAVFHSKNGVLHPKWTIETWTYAKELVKRCDSLTSIPSTVFGKQNRGSIPNLYVFMVAAEKKRMSFIQYDTIPISEPSIRMNE